MKFLSLIFLFTLFTLFTASVFSKGGDFPPINHGDLLNRLKAFKQIDVVIGATSDFNDYYESREELADILSNIKEEYPLTIKRKNKDQTTSFCLFVNVSGHKKLVANKISKELKLFPRSVSTSVDSNLAKPCM